MQWITTWSGKLLHAVTEEELDEARDKMKRYVITLCGQYALPWAKNDRQKKRLEKGSPHCKSCEKFAEKRGLT